MDIPATTREVCDLLRNSIIMLLRAYKDPSIDATAIRIFPNHSSQTIESDDSEEDPFCCVCFKQMLVVH